MVSLVTVTSFCMREGVRNGLNFAYGGSVTFETKIIPQTRQANFKTKTQNHAGNMKSYVRVNVCLRVVSNARGGKVKRTSVTMTVCLWLLAISVCRNEVPHILISEPKCGLNVSYFCQQQQQQQVSAAAAPFCVLHTKFAAPHCRLFLIRNF